MRLPEPSGLSTVHLASRICAGEYAFVKKPRTPLGPMISARTGLDQAADWFARLYAHEPNIFKVIVEP